MPTIKELGLQEGQQVFCFGVEKETPPGAVLDGLHLGNAMADPATKVKFALVKLIKRGKLSDLLGIICTNSFDWAGIDHRDFPDVVKTKNITSIHNLYPNYIADGVGPKIPTELSICVVATNRPFENRSNLVTPEGEIVGELVVNNQGMSMSWNLEFLERQRE